MVSKIDRKTLVELQSGNISCFEEVLCAYEQPVLNYIYRIVGQRQDAEDLTQEAFIHLYENISKIAPDNNFKAWLYRIATNTVLNWLRKKNRIKEVPIIFEATGEENINEIALIDEFQSQAIKNIENTEDISKALDCLRPIHKSLIILFYYHEFSYREIAYILSLPIGTIKTNLHKARKNLKEVLYKQGFILPPKTLNPRPYIANTKRDDLSFSKN